MISGELWLNLKKKQCPYCAEDIKSAATVSKNCGRELLEYEGRTNTLYQPNNDTGTTEGAVKVKDI
jgi:hypothetical protein